MLQTDLPFAVIWHAAAIEGSSKRGVLSKHSLHSDLPHSECPSMVFISTPSAGNLHWARVLNGKRCGSEGQVYQRLVAHWTCNTELLITTYARWSDNICAKKSPAWQKASITRYTC